MPPACAATKWDPDREDPSIRRWRENLRRGCVATGDAWFRALRRYCGESQRTAHDVLRLKPKSRRDLFMDFATSGSRAALRRASLDPVRALVNGIFAPHFVHAKNSLDIFSTPRFVHGSLRRIH